jgi:sulfate adenylyltransferase
VCLPYRDLDAIERLRLGAVADPGGLVVPLAPEDQAAAAQAGLEVVDPEGVPLARYGPGQIGAHGAVGPPVWLGRPPQRPFEACYRPAPEVRDETPRDALVVAIDRPPGPEDAAALRRAGEGRFLVLLVLAGPTLSPYSRGVERLRPSVRLVRGLGEGAVVAVPLDPAEADRDPGLFDDVLARYFPGPVRRLDELVGAAGAGEGRPGGVVLFFTGLSGSGKSTVARAVRAAIVEETGRAVSFLDGDVVRRSLSSELTFSPRDRDANILRIGWVAAEIAYHGGVAICSPIAPYAATRRAVREMTVDRGGDFVLVHVSTPLEECERRDRKGLYARARAGEIPDFTGVSAPYEVPVDADLEVDTTGISVEEARDRVLSLLRRRGHLQAGPDPSVRPC